VSSPSKTYRIYCYDAVHKVLTTDEIDAASDEEAVAMARAACPSARAEVWEGHRLVAELDEERAA